MAAPREADAAAGRRGRIVEGVKAAPNNP